MKDFLGNELSVGDDVIFITSTYNEFNIGYITRFTPKNVVVAKSEAWWTYVRPWCVIKFNKAAKNV